MNKYKKIAQIRYEINSAIESVPKRDYNKVKDDVMNILGITSFNQLGLYKNGISSVTLSKAKAIEAYFMDNYGITDVWKEVKELQPAEK